LPSIRSRLRDDIEVILVTCRSCPAAISARPEMAKNLACLVARIIRANKQAIMLRALPGNEYQLSSSATTTGCTFAESVDPG